MGNKTKKKPPPKMITMKIRTVVILRGKKRTVIRQGHKEACREVWKFLFLDPNTVIRPFNNSLSYNLLCVVF